MKTHKSRAGFTLIELLVVISIIGVLASVVLVSVKSARTSAYDAKYLASITNLRTAIELSRDNAGNYPPTDAASLNQTIGSDVFSSDINGSNILETRLNEVVPKYLPSIPHYNGWTFDATASSDKTSPSTALSYFRNRTTFGNGRTYYSCSQFTKLRDVYGRAMLIISYSGLLRGFGSGSHSIWYYTAAAAGLEPASVVSSEVLVNSWVAAPANGYSVLCIQL